MVQFDSNSVCSDRRLGLRRPSGRHRINSIADNVKFGTSRITQIVYHLIDLLAVIDKNIKLGIQNFCQFLCGSRTL